MKPLEGTVVLDFSRVLAGPYCTMILRNLGARVIKVEALGTGDDARGTGPFIAGQSGYFASINRGKESIALNLRQPQAKEIALSLATKADVVVENFRPGVMRRLGLDYETVRGVNEDVVYASCSGFGQSGPYADRPAYDIIVQAMGGIMSVTGLENGEPMRVGVSQGDMVAGIFTAVGVLAGLLKRWAGGGGSYVDVSMLDSQVALMWHPISFYCASGEDPRPIGSRHPATAPFDVFACADRHLTIGVGTQEQWRSLCEVLDLKELIDDERFADNTSRVRHQAELKQHINRQLAKRTAAEWEEMLVAKEIPCGAINRVSDLLKDEHLRLRGAIVEVKDPELPGFRAPALPFHIDGESLGETAGPPKVGQHTEAILSEFLGLTADQVFRLRQEKIAG